MQNKPLVASLISASSSQSLRDVSNIEWKNLGAGNYNEVLQNGNEVLKIAKLGWGFRYVSEKKDIKSILAEKLYRPQIVCLNGESLFYISWANLEPNIGEWRLHNFPGVMKQSLKEFKTKFEMNPSIERLSYADLLWIETILFAKYEYNGKMFVGINWDKKTDLKLSLCQLTHEADRPSRIKRIHDDINPHLPPAEIVYYKGAGECVICPLIEGIQATPKQTIDAVIDCYVNTGRVLVDAIIGGNVFFNSRTKKTSIADGALAILLQSELEVVVRNRVRRRSDQSIGLWESQKTHYQKMWQEYFENVAVNDEERNILFVIEALLFIQKYRSNVQDVSFLKITSLDLIIQLAKAFYHESIDSMDSSVMVIKALAAFDKEYKKHDPSDLAKFQVGKVACLSYLSTFKYTGMGFFDQSFGLECAHLLEKTTSLDEFYEQIETLPNQQIAAQLKNLLSIEIIKQPMNAAAARC